ANGVGHQRIVFAISGRGWSLRLVEGSVWRLSWICRRMDVLGLHDFLFPRTIAGKRVDERLRARWQGRSARPGSDIFASGIAGVPAGRRNFEYRRIEYRKMAAKRGRSCHLRAVDDPPGRRRGAVAQEWIDHTLHLGQREAHLELGHRKFLVA